MKQYRPTLLTLVCGMMLLLGPPPTCAAQMPKRIVALSGALAETVVALGFGSRLVAVDVTSTYPKFVSQLPRVSKNRSLSAEGLLSFDPDLVLAPEGDISRELRFQLKAAGIRLITFNQQYTATGAYQFIREVAQALDVPQKGAELALKTQRETEALLNTIKPGNQRPSVLFIYARGAGLMTVAGKGSNMDAIITLAGGRNAIREFTDFKPYSTEALVQADPDVVLLFDFGLESLGGATAILELPGMSGTRAGRNKRILQADGQLMINFSVRLPEAIRTLHQLLYP